MPTRNRGGRPLNRESHEDLARLQCHEMAYGLVTIDEELKATQAQITRLRHQIRGVWSSLQSTAMHLDTAADLPVPSRTAVAS